MEADLDSNVKCSLDRQLFIALPDYIKHVTLFTCLQLSGLVSVSCSSRLIRVK